MHIRLVLGLVFLVPTMAVAQEEHHHAPAPGEKLGSVHFATSCSPAAQKEFERALAMQHSFWYEESEGAFRAIVDKEPSCAIAGWGVAMSFYHPLWDPPSSADLQRGQEAIAQAQAARARTQRERDYVDALAEFYRDWEHRDHRTRALAWSAALERVHRTYPDDLEATLFYALSLIATQLPTDKALANNRRAADLLEPIFQQHPDHPGVAHYLIHAYDSPALAQYGVKAARRYAQIAPSAPHALHMPSHIFTRLGLWDDSIQSNLASAASARRYGEEQHLNTAWDEELHAEDYLIYAYLQEGQDAKAHAIYERALKLANDSMTNKGQFALFSIPVRWFAERHAWKEAAAIEPTPQANPVPQAISWWARAVGAARSGQTETAEAAVRQLASLRDRLQQHDTYWAGQVDILWLEAAGWLSRAGGDNEGALKSLTLAADREDATDKNSVTPGGLLPAREQLADLQAELNQPKEALANYRAALQSAPRRFNSVYGAAHAAELAGDMDEARRFYRQLADLCRNADGDRPELARARTFLAQQ